jgi:spore germination protein GerM
MVVFPALLRGAVTELLEGPTVAERTRSYGGWFSRRTAGMLRSVRIAAGVAYVDFRDFRRIVPNASSSCGSALLLAQLNRTATQFASVDRTVYSIDGSRREFYEWLQRSAP